MHHTREGGAHPLDLGADATNILWRTEPSMGALTARPPAASRMVLAVTRRLPPAASATSTVCPSINLPKPSAAPERFKWPQGT